MRMREQGRGELPLVPNFPDKQELVPPATCAHEAAETDNEIA